MIQVFLIEHNLLFRLGLRMHLEQTGIYEVVGEAEAIETALGYLSRLSRVDVILLALDHNRQWRWCERLRFKYPHIPVLLMLPDHSIKLAKSARQWGIEGICSRETAPDQIAIALQRLANGELVQNFSNPPLSKDLSIWATVFNMVRSQLSSSAINQIESELDQLKSKSNSFLVTAQKRELKAAEWLIQKIYRVPLLKSKIEQNRNSIKDSNQNSGLVLTGTKSKPELKSKASIYFDQVSTRLQSDLINFSNQPLEIDVLKPAKRRELLYIVLHQFEDLLLQIEQNQIDQIAIANQRDSLLDQIWLRTVDQFFNRINLLDSLEIINQIKADLEIVKVEILNRIPLFPQLVCHLVYQTTLLESFAIESQPNIKLDAEALIENLLIQIANSVIQPLLNYFSDRLEIQHQLFDTHHLSSREIERFRNDLSWRYRIQTNFDQPKAIFESRYQLFVFLEDGIKSINIHALRSEELQSLTGVSALVTLALEFQDAVSPRFRNLAAFLGKVIVYLLTNLVGRGIGLVGRGILQGIGNAWQEPRSRIKKD